MTKIIHKNFKILEKIKDELLFLSKSEIRLKILECIKKTPFSVKEIVKLTGLSYSSVSSNVNKLEQNMNIFKIDNRYEMNPITEIYLNNLLEFNSTLKLINKFKEFWNLHNINEIDEKELENITDLKNSKLIKSTPSDIYRTHNTIKSFLLNSYHIRAIFPFLHPDYPKILENQLLKEGKVEIIVPEEIYKDLILKIDPKVRKRSLNNGKLIVHTTEKPIDLYLTVCERRITLGLFKNDGSFDQNRILISRDKKAHEWSENLFNEIKSQI